MASQRLGHVLFIGGNGFLGHYIISQALDRWSTMAVTSVDLRCDRNRVPGAAYHECDIADAARLRDLMASLKPDVVIHTASPVAGGDSAVANDIFAKVNVDGTRAVVDACQETAVKALVYTSSASVISDNRTDLVNADETWPVIRGDQQHEYYTETKAAAEEIVLDANRRPGAGLVTASFRPAGLFGEDDAQMLPGLLRAYRNGNTKVQMGDNRNLFDFTYVGNAAHAHLLAAHALLAAAAEPDGQRVDGQNFITNDSPRYFWDFARSVWRAAGDDATPEQVWKVPRTLALVLGSLSEMYFSAIGKPPTFTRQRVVFSTMTRYYNIAKAKSVLRYKPLWTMEEGVSRSVAWFLEREKESAAEAP